MRQPRSMLMPECELCHGEACLELQLLSPVIPRGGMPLCEDCGQVMAQLGTSQPIHMQPLEPQHG